MKMMETLRTVASSDYFVPGLTAVASVAAGLATGYFASKKQLEAKYETLMDEQIAAAKDYYRRINKKDEFATPESTAEALGVELEDEVVDVETLVEKVSTTTVSELMEPASKALVDYSAISTSDRDTDVEIPPELADLVRDQKVVVDTSEEHNVFTDAPPTVDFDYDSEVPLRTDDAPYVISHDEFMENETDYQQPSLTYYAEDKVLADERDEPIEDVDKTVGEENLHKFGYGSKDSRRVYVRNPVLELEFEIELNTGSFARDVWGLEEEETDTVIRHSSDRHSGLRRFRGDDE